MCEVIRGLAFLKPDDIDPMQETPVRNFPGNRSRPHGSIPSPIRADSTPKVNSWTTTTLTKPKEPDMVNDYYPFVDFKLVFPEIMPVIEGPRHFLLIVLVNSGSRGDEFRRRRNAIRQTWGNRENCEQLKAMTKSKFKNLRWMLVFVLAKARNDADKKNVEEAKEHNDMIIGDIDDIYVNLIIKNYMAQLWASTFNVKYTLKCDDDIFLRIPGIINYLGSQGFPKRFYGGKTYTNSYVFRDPKSKWGLSRKYYANAMWPPFNAGAFIVLSADLLASLFGYVYIRKPFHTEDTYIAVAMKDLNVKCVTIPGLDIQPNMPVLLTKKTDCQILSLIGYGHDFGPESTMSLHKRIETMCTKNISTHQC